MTLLSCGYLVCAVLRGCLGLSFAVPGAEQHANVDNECQQTVVSAPVCS